MPVVTVSKQSHSQFMALFYDADKVVCTNKHRKEKVNLLCLEKKWHFFTFHSEMFLHCRETFMFWFLNMVLIALFKVILVLSTTFPSSVLTEHHKYSKQFHFFVLYRIWFIFSFSILSVTVKDEDKKSGNQTFLQGRLWLVCQFMTSISPWLSDLVRWMFGCLEICRNVALSICHLKEDTWIFRPKVNFFWF